MIKDTKDAIRALPISHDLKHRLVEQFDAMDTGARHDLISLVWDAYDSLVDDKIDEKFYDRFWKIAEGEEEVTGSEYAAAMYETEQELAQETETAVRDDELSEVRDKLKTIITSNST